MIYLSLYKSQTKLINIHQIDGGMAVLELMAVDVLANNTLMCDKQ